MDQEFWHTKWRANEIGFHQAEIHPLLLTCWPKLKLARGSRVLVPLCGKSQDLRWLLDAGFDVLGIELSELAVTAFFAENDLRPVLDSCGPFRRYQVARLCILCGDFMQARAEDIGYSAAVYDRAALIALRPPLRREYVSILSGLLGVGGKGLLICVDYPRGSVTPPPFIVEATELNELYGTWCELVEVERRTADVKGFAAEERAYEFLARGN